MLQDQRIRIILHIQYRSMHYLQCLEAWQVAYLAKESRKTEISQALILQLLGLELALCEVGMQGCLLQKGIYLRGTKVSRFLLIVP